MIRSRLKKSLRWGYIPIDCLDTLQSSWMEMVVGLSRGGYPRIEGHRRGVSTVRSIVEQCSRLGLDQLTLYCFSSENWKRPAMELKLLMQLLEQYLIEEQRAEIVRRQNLRFAVIGRREGLADGGYLNEIARTCEVSRNNTGMRLCLAVNYGSRGELVDAARAIAQEVAAGKLCPGGFQIDEQVFADHLYDGGNVRPGFGHSNGRRNASQQLSSVANQLC